MKAVIEKIKTGARWSSEDHLSKVWTKISLGRNHSHDTQPVGATWDNFDPFTKKNKERYRLISLHGE